MKKRLWSLGLCGILMIVMAWPVLAGPWKVIHGDTLIRKGEVVKGDLYFSGESLEIEGEVQGDVVVMASVVKVSGKIDGSLSGAILEKLTLSGVVGEDLRVAVNQLNISGTVGETISAVAVIAELSSKSVIEKGMIGIFHQLKLSGRINGPVRITGYSTTVLGGKINGDMQIRGVPVTWTKGVKVNGDVDDYSGITNTASTTHAKINGDYRIHQDNELIMKVMKSLLLFSLIWFLGSVLIGLIIYKLFPRTSWKVSEPSIFNFRKHLLSGLVGALGIPVLIIILAITRVGIPLAVLLGLGYLMLLLFSNVLLYLWIGRLIFAKSHLDIRRHPVLLIITGGFVLAILGFVPFAGYFLQVIGFGMVISQIRPELDENQHEDILA